MLKGKDVLFDNFTGSFVIDKSAVITSNKNKQGRNEIVTYTLYPKKDERKRKREKESGAKAS